MTRPAYSPTVFLDEDASENNWSFISVSPSERHFGPSTSGITGGIALETSNENTSTCALANGGQVFPDVKVSSNASQLINGRLFNLVSFGACAPADCLTIYQDSVTVNGECYRLELAVNNGMPLDEATPESATDSEFPRAEAALQALFQRMLSTVTINAPKLRSN